MLDESKKSVLAIEASKAKGSEAARNREARCTDTFREYLK